jgi:POT family proton-dependent oligopeptide transporter
MANQNSLVNQNAFARLRQFPIGFWFVFWGELAERASYYGMRTLLVMFLLDSIHFDRGKSIQIVQNFMSACYLLPFLGGYLADHWWGKYKTILIFSVPYIIGHFILGSSTESTMLYVALVLLALGVGSVKPNISPLMGSIFEKAGKTELLSEAYSYFYAAINIGAFATSAALPPIRDHYGYKIALAVPAFAMIGSMAMFAFGKKFYPTEKIKTEPKTSEQRKEERDILIRISGVFALIVGFWLVYDQSASTWVVFARDHMDLRLWPLNVVVTPDQVQACNPLFIVVLTPLFIWFWNHMERKNGKAVPAVTKMIYGFITTFLCMAAMAVAGWLSKGGLVSVWWEIIATFVITIGELCISVVGLELAYTVATPRTKSTVTAAFLFTVSIGDYLGGVIGRDYDKMSPAAFFGLQTAILAFCTVAFYFVGKKFQSANQKVVV